MFNLTEEEEKVFKGFTSPAEIQDYVNALKVNFDFDKDTCMSPRMVLKTGKAHCIEGAIFAALALRYLGFKPLLVDIRGTKDDCDHVVAVFKKNGKWGAISKTNHAVLRYREPIYRDIRELILSYFHEYSDSKGNKTLREYSVPVDLTMFDDTNWAASEEDLWHIHDYLDQARHFEVLTPKQEENLRLQDQIEIDLDKFVEYKVPKK